MFSIVMYHYVRDLPSSRFPRIKGMQVEDFERQLRWITKHYEVCTTQQVIAAATGESRLPPNACLLTFDDGFIDHYSIVFPRLEEHGIAGSFYPAAAPIKHHQVLDVHKIHFLLASAEDYKSLAQETFSLLKPYRQCHTIPNDEDLSRSYARRGRLDPPEIMLMKGVLQRGLPEPVRVEVLNELFRRHVTDDEISFAKELYMDMAQLRCMARHGMVIGGHGDRHLPLQTLDRKQQHEEIVGTLRFLEKVYDGQVKEWVMCYPWGTYNDVTLEVLREAGGALGLAYGGTPVNDLSRPLELTRVDAHDLRL